MTHSSLALTKLDGVPLNYERLEFLGDSVIDLIVSSFLFESAPEQNEGYLTDMRSKIVNRKSLNKLGKELKIDDLLISNLSLDQSNKNVLGNTIEALVGAIYLDHGYETCKSFVMKYMVRLMGGIQSLESKVISYKNVLIKWCQKNKYTPVFKTDTENEKTKNPCFHSIFHLNQMMISKGEGLSKKLAEEKAAKNACLKLGIKTNKN